MAKIVRFSEQFLYDHFSVRRIWVAEILVRPVKDTVWSGSSLFIFRFTFFTRTLAHTQHETTLRTNNNLITFGCGERRCFNFNEYSQCFCFWLTKPLAKKRKQMTLKKVNAFLLAHVAINLYSRKIGGELLSQSNNVIEKCHFDHANRQKIWNIPSSSETLRRSQNAASFAHEQIFMF